MDITLNDIVRHMDDEQVEQIKKFYSQFVSFKGKYFLTDQNQTTFVEFDPEDDEFLDRFNISKLQINTLKSYGNTDLTSIVPEELRDHYCLIFGGVVFFSTKNYDEFVKHKKEANIIFTEYYPQK